MPDTYRLAQIFRDVCFSKMSRCAAGGPPSGDDVQQLLCQPVEPAYQKRGSQCCSSDCITAWPHASWPL